MLAEDAAAKAADKAALMGAVSSDVLPQLNFPLDEHVMSDDPVLWQAAREVVDHFDKKILPRMVHSKIRKAQARITAGEAKAARKSKSSGNPAKRKKRQTTSATS